MITRTLFVENLTARQLMAIDVAEFEPNNSESQATPFQLPATEAVILRGNSTSQNDKDYFAFTAHVSGPVTVEVNSNAGAKLEVATRAGAQLFESEPKDGVNSGTFQSVAGTAYLLRLRAPDKAAAAYTVTVAAGGTVGTPSHPDDSTGGSSGGTSSGSSVAEAEPNDDAGRAIQLSLVTNEPRTLTGTASKKDRDFFVITPTSTGTVSIDTGASGIKVSIETRQGAKLFESEPNDGVTNGAFSVAAGQDFVLRVRGLRSSTTDYSIAISLTGTPEPGSGTTAAAVSPGVPIQWLDVSDDGVVSALDALLVINQLSREHQAAHDAAMLQFDLNDDSCVSPLDALLVINHLTSRSRRADDRHPEGESSQHALRSEGSDDLIETEVHRNRRKGR